MTGIIDWAANRARMVLAFIALSLLAGGLAYSGLPKEGEPDIEIPALFISVVFPGISAADSEAMLVKPMETELADIDSLKKMSATAAENYAGLALEFEFGWNKTKVIADVRDAMSNAEEQFPDGVEKYSINEINFSEFPIIIVNLTGQVPERTISRIARDLQEKLERNDAVLEAGIAGSRDEMLEVLIDPLRLEAYNVTAGELISVVRNNNQLIAAGDVKTAQGSFSIKIPSSFKDVADVYALPVKTNGDRVVTLGELADISLTFQDRNGTSRFNGETTVALQVVKRKGYNLLDIAETVKQIIDTAKKDWPEQMRATVQVGTSNDQSVEVKSMVRQLESSVLTAVALVMIVVLCSLGTRAALLVGFAIPTSFLLSFALMAVVGVTISNMVMFGLILAVGMLVDGAIVVVEYADKQIARGVGPMHAYVQAAKRMFWPVTSSTATTLCAFLPMLFWPGVPGEFMSMLPITLIFVLSASLVVALIYLPVLGGVSGRFSRKLTDAAGALRRKLPWLLRAALVPIALYTMFIAVMQIVNPGYLFGGTAPFSGPASLLPGAVLFVVSALCASVTLNAAKIKPRAKRIDARYKRTLFGSFIQLIAGNPIMPLVSIIGVGAVVVTVFNYFGENNNGVEFFVDSEAEQAIVYVKARGNLSLQEKDALVRKAEAIILTHTGIKDAFAFAGNGGLKSNTGGAQRPKDSIGQIQLETIPWEDRSKRPDLDGDLVLATLQDKLDQIPGIQTEILVLAAGPSSGKPLHLRLKGNNWDDLLNATEIARQKFETTQALTQIEDSRPLPGIDWRIDVDVLKAGRYGADVATVGAMVQLVTRGILLDKMRVDSSDEEIEIRVRFPEKDRLLSTLDTVKLRTEDGLVPLANFVTRTPVQKLAEINRADQKRHIDVKADVLPEQLKSGVDDSGQSTQQMITPSERIDELTKWLQTRPFPAGIEWEWTGDQEEQSESQAFLKSAFMGALGLMFIILLAQFNSFYNSVLVLLAVVLSTTGVLIGMIVMDQAFSIIMTGTGIVALAGIVVNNNIVLIDTYQEYCQYMPRIEAIIRTAEARIRPVLLTTITTMAGLAPMMFGLSLDFIQGGYSIDSPTALWWKQLATAVVFGLGIATILTLVFTPSMLALRIWATTYSLWLLRLLSRLSLGRSSQAARDWALQRSANRKRAPEIIWSEEYRDKPSKDEKSEPVQNQMQPVPAAE